MLDLLNVCKFAVLYLGQREKSNSTMIYYVTIYTLIRNTQLLPHVADFNLRVRNSSNDSWYYLLFLFFRNIQKQRGNNPYIFMKIILYI